MRRHVRVPVHFFIRYVDKHLTSRRESSLPQHRLVKKGVFCLLAKDDERDHVVEQMVGVIELEDAALLARLADNSLLEARLTHGRVLGIGSMALPLRLGHGRLQLPWQATCSL